MKRVVLKIYGDVQGVFYRAQVRDIACELGLVGWARNEPDGTVKIVAEGEEAKLKKLVGRCYNVPNARVGKVDVGWEGATGEFEEFEIRYH